RALERNGERLIGSGTVDMKGGVVIAIGVLNALAARPDSLGEVALLLVTDEEWRVGGLEHADLFAEFDACLCLEAGQAGPGGKEGVIVKRKAAGTLRVRGHGVSSHSGPAPLLAPAGEVLGRPVVGMERGGASDASHVAALVPITVDGLGSRGGGAHNPDEYVLAESLHTRAQVALAVVAALLELG